MNKGIVICSHTNTEKQLFNSISFISSKNYNIPIYYVINGCFNRLRVGNCILLDEDRFELGAIYEAVHTFDLDEFILLQDTIEVKDVKLFDMAFEQENKTVYFFHRFMCYAGKYRKEILNKIGIPIVNTKFDSVIQEDLFHKKYFEAEPDAICLFPDLNDTDNFEEKFGRNNMIIENNFIKKYKGTWNLGMIQQ